MSGTQRLNVYCHREWATLMRKEKKLIKRKNSEGSGEWEAEKRCESRKLGAE